MDSLFDIPGLDPTDAFSSAFADDLLGGDVFGLNGGGSILGLDMDMMDPFGGPGSSSSSLLSDVFNSPTSTTSGSDYGSSMSSFSAATMEDTLCEADLFQSFASAKNFAVRNKVRLNNAMKARNGGGAVRNTHNNSHNNSHHTHNNNNTYKKYRRPTISMGNNGGGGSSVPKVYISTFSHNKRNGGGGSSSSAGSGTSILLKSKRGNGGGGGGGSRNGRGGGSSLISSKMSTTITSHHHQPRHRSGMYGHVQQQQLQQQQYQQRQPKQIPKTIKFNRSGAGSGSGACYQLPGSSSISKGNVFPQKNGSCKSKNSGSSHSSINNNGRNNNSSGAANRSSFQAAAAAAQVQQTKVVPIPNPSADHDYCVVYTEAMFASSTAASSNNSSDHLNSSLDDILISSSQSSNSCPNVDSFLNDHLFSLGSPSAMLNDNMNSIDGSGGSGDIHLKKGGQQSSTEVANDLEDLLDGFIPDDVLLNELPNCLQDLFDLDLNSLMDVKSEDVLDGLNDGKQLVVITPLFS